MQTSPAGKTASSQKGFTYAVVLAAVVIVGIAAELTYLSTVRIVQAEREAELLFRGQAYRRAIESYYRANSSYPRALDDLLEDPRSPSRRHIRALYHDPMSKEPGQSWLLIRASDGGIGGVASRASGKPIKTANFPVNFDKFNGASSYSDWVFDYVPPTPAMGSKTVGEASSRATAPGATR